MYHILLHISQLYCDFIMSLLTFLFIYIIRIIVFGNAMNQIQSDYFIVKHSSFWKILTFLKIFFLHNFDSLQYNSLFFLKKKTFNFLVFSFLMTEYSLFFGVLEYIKIKFWISYEYLKFIWVERNGTLQNVGHLHLFKL